jgi:cobalt/nickel transport system permease protein
VLFGGFVTSVLALIVLIYQALLLAHGGITTMGANVFSMGVAGPLVAWILYRAGKQVNLNTFVNIFIAAFIADLFTYVVTSFQLALAFPAAEGGLLSSFAAFMAIFALTQVPLAIVEGVIVALTFKYIIDVRPDILVKLDVLTQNTLNRLKEAAA